MPLNKTCSGRALSDNIAAEVKAGKTHEQAVAIASEVLREACKKAGKPVPTSGEIKAALLPQKPKLTGQKRPRSTEYLEAVLAKARKVLNPRDFAVIYQSARGSAGGKIAAKNKKAVNKSDLVFVAPKTVQQEATQGVEMREKAGRGGTSTMLLRAKAMAAGESITLKSLVEMGRFLADGEKDKEVPVDQGDGQIVWAMHGGDAGQRWIEHSLDSKRIRKGFNRLTPDAGVHVHGLDRMSSKTQEDGRHTHAFLLPGTMNLFVTYVGGKHTHDFDPKKDSTGKGGQHSHYLIGPDGDEVRTKEGGEHIHELMIETSTFGGIHTHILTLEDGVEIESLTPSEHVRLIESPYIVPPGPSSEDFMYALGGEDELPDLHEALELTACGYSIPDPSFLMEVIEKTEGSLALSFSDGDEAYEAEGCTDGFEVGDIVSIVNSEVSKSTGSAMSLQESENVRSHADLLQRHTTQVGFAGNEKAALLFVSAAPSGLEVARKQALVGEDGAAFDSMYLNEIGMDRGDVACGFIMPTLPVGELAPDQMRKWYPQFIETLKSYPSAQIVALGKQARDSLNEIGFAGHVYIPHPSAVRKRGDKGEIKRKLHSVKKALDATGEKVSPLGGSGEQMPAKIPSKGDPVESVMCSITKSVSEKQIVYGVVLDPYDVDTQGEWVPPSEVESTAHGFLKKSRVIGFEHLTKASAQIVESWIEAYPSKADYKSAMQNLPHTITKRKFGGDFIHSGSWIAGVQLGDAEWAMYRDGKLNAFSIGGFSFKADVSKTAMPKIEIIELK